LFTLILLLRGNRAAAVSASAGVGQVEKVGVGFVAGIMGGVLAMPGPVPAAWMSAKGYDKDTIRATILVMFVVAYSFALVLQLSLAEVSANTLRLTAVLVPATVAGVFVGKVLSHRISEATFRSLITIVLTLTVVLLFGTLA
jgi:hypothetical protein